MIFKYYTADLMIFGNNELQSPSITIRTWFWCSPLKASKMMKGKLDDFDLDGHGLFNLRRIK